MAPGPDPNRWQPSDPELPPHEEEDATPLGSPPSTRFGLPSWSIALIALLIAIVVVVLLVR
ncbi:hypothetical protein BH23GEM3_BH23GEM3_14160 [soil metagenome]|nr:hypothetical protein [Gemmatimonadota bacterium]